MKVFIGPYPKHYDFDPFFNKLKRVLTESFVDKLEDVTYKIVHKFQRQEQKVSVRIDKYDTFSMDHTLALIILPMLKQLKATQHGAPNVDDKDVPKELKSKFSPKTKDEHIDDNHFKRWEWVLNEIIFAFENIVDESWQEKFHSGKSDYASVACAFDDKGEPTLFEMKKGPNHTAKFDAKGYAAYEKRIKNGLRLFGTYYQGLWD